MRADLQARFLILDRGRCCRRSIRFVCLHRFLSGRVASVCGIGGMERIGVLGYSYRCDVKPEVIGKGGGILSRIDATDKSREYAQSE
jgi:hypothetical protein